jgi:hypothetical protein
MVEQKKHVEAIGSVDPWKITLETVFGHICPADSVELAKSERPLAVKNPNVTN